MSLIIVNKYIIIYKYRVETQGHNSLIQNYEKAEIWQLGNVPKTPRGGGAHKMGGGQMISPKNGGSIDAIGHFWGECSSKVIFLGGV